MESKRDADAIPPLNTENQNKLGKELNSWSNNPVDAEKGYVDHTATVSTKRTGWWRYAGIIFALLAAFFFTLSTLTSKMLSQKDYHALNLALWRNLGMIFFVPFLILFIRYGQKQRIFDILWADRGKLFYFLLLRGTIGFCALILYILSLKYLNLADASVITFSTPIVVTLFARVCLGESCGIIPIITSLMTLFGVIVLMRPPMLTGEEAFDTNILIGTAFAFGCMIFLTMVFIVVRYLRDVHWGIVIMFYGYVASIESFILAVFLGALELPKTNEDYMIVAVNALVTLIGQAFMTLSLKYEEAGPIALIRTSDIVLVFIAQLIFLGVYPDYISILGAGIIMFGIVVTTCRKWLSTLPEKHPNRMKYGFLLK